MEKQIKNKKRMLLYSIFAIAIGIATILPLSYLTLSVAGETQNTPFFNPTMMYITAIPHTETLYDEPYVTTIYPNGTVIHSEIPDTGSINVCMCYDITPEGANLKNVDAKIEVYNFHFYTDQGSILNMTHSVAIAGSVPDSNSPNGITSAIAEWNSDKNTYTFADGTVYDFTKTLGYVEESVVCYFSTEESTATRGHQIMGGGPVLSESNGEKTAQALTDLRNAETIYVDVTRILQVTYKHPSNPNTSSVIATTPTSNDVLCHIELSELDNMGRAIYENDHRNDHEKFLTIEAPMAFIP
ncbi:hypothetical protein [Candidatus Bathycorpusculum sp.]|uniref:hypothetical protein n=1 Tax=Candidatus Bathycorpusculum sp. TaxID=2994959 RepID=UPI00282BDC71|nr:hypothetical protein [Candidatus Termitimicrobium sp.]MCL2431236.1 hypothetical protein [Candidatus Termitimicrobium sp.]